MQASDIIVYRPKGMWGRPSSVTAQAWAALPEPMRREGVLMLIDMGVTVPGIARQLGVEEDAVRGLLAASPPPWKRHEPDVAVAEDR